MLNIYINNGWIDEKFNIQNIKLNNKQVIILDNNVTPAKQVEAARSCWKYKDLEDRIAVITYSDFFLKEINSLIMISCLNDNQRQQVLNCYPEYEESFFVNRSNVLTNITCFDIELNELCDLDNLGFEVKSMDKVIDRMNQLQEYILWGLDE